MSLTSDEVRHVARLARLALDDAQVEALRDQLSGILDYAAKVGEVATEEVPPTGHPSRMANVLRDDRPRPSLPQDEVLAAAPVAEDGRFQVPRIVDEEQGPTAGGHRS